MVEAIETHHLEIKLQYEESNNEQRYHLYLATATWYILDWGTLRSYGVHKSGQI